MSPLAYMRQLFSRAADGYRVDYQPEADLLFAWLGEPRPADNVEVEPGIYVRVLPDTQEVVGIEVLDCAERFGRKPQTIDASFAASLVEKYRAAALAGVNTRSICAAR